MTKEILLTKGKVAIVDDEDFEWLLQWKWQCTRKGYASRGERIGKKETKGTLMHRQIMNTPLGLQTDHIDGNKLNNTRNNLRVCNQNQNQHNRKKQKGRSRYKGVSFYKQNKKWVAQIQKDNKKIHLGYFETELDAAQAYNFAAVEHFGEFARFNRAA